VLEKQMCGFCFYHMEAPGLPARPLPPPPPYLALDGSHTLSQTAIYSGVISGMNE
jgi:hypothetical protein